MQTKLQQEINNILKQFPEYWENGELLKNKVIDDLRDYKEGLIEALLSNQLIKETYSIEVGKNTIFKLEDFISMLRFKNYWQNSYTKYSNEIGLTSEGKYLKYNTDVVLDFPYKDTVLEGGMSKEDVGKNEVYYHSVLAKEEIDVMLSPKVLSNVKKYNSNGDHQMFEVNEDDNLILKGNNLIALHSLKERYAGKVKLIYIDPPYNTGNDSFKYNDRFNHSTWLTFMKNRLTIARQLLSKDGLIWINIDDDESHYLKVLSDEVFGRENFISNIIWQKKYTISNDAKFFSDNHDHILVYARSRDLVKLNGLPRSKEMNERYKNQDNDPKGPWMTQPLHAKSGNNTKFSFTFKNGVTWEPPRGTYPRYSKASLKKFEAENKIWFGNNGSAVPRVKKYLFEMGNVTPATIWSHVEVGNNDQANKEIRYLNDTYDFSTPKPEKLLQRIIQIGSNEKDVVLDFFMGSATTQAVAHKMNRQYIGIEQMDYINEVSVPRLQKVINGEQGGVSEDLNWQGGGSFVYAELQELNQFYVNHIQQASTKEELSSVISEIKEQAFLDFKVDMDQVTTENDNFSSLTLEEQKDVLIKVIDENQLYLPYSEMDDATYDVPDQIKQFNDSFYGSENQ